jgi:ribonuclease MRP protein subunit RMP1
MPSPREELHSISQILHLTHHRNKNQHRLAKWYKSFSMLRRHVSKLSSELETNIQYTALSAKAKKTIESRAILGARVAFLQDVLIERCYLAFSQLVADNQYAALGLMLMGCLARVRKVIKPLGRDRDDDDELTGEEKGEGLEKKEELDLGEVIKREELHVEEAGEERNPDEEDGENDAQLRRPKKKKRSVTVEEAKESTVKDSTTTKRLKKKRKKRDAFDDLFDGLV